MIAAVCLYLIAYRFYSKFLALRVVGLDDNRATPAERLENGRLPAGARDEFRQLFGTILINVTATWDYLRSPALRAPGALT